MKIEWSKVIQEFKNYNCSLHEYDLQHDEKTEMCRFILVASIPDVGEITFDRKSFPTAELPIHLERILAFISAGRYGFEDGEWKEQKFQFLMSVLRELVEVIMIDECVLNHAWSYEHDIKEAVNLIIKKMEIERTNALFNRA